MESKEDLEREYTPSLFSRRFPTRDQLLEHFQTFAKSESERSRMKHDCHLNIAYGTTKREKLDIFGDDLKPDSPLFVYVHGGYWQMMDKENSAYVVAPLVQKGIRVIVIDYELCPTVTLEEIVNQVQRAFNWIADYVHKNKIQSVSIAGHSAGAHLVACALTKEFVLLLSSDVKLYIYLISGIYDLRELRHLKAANENNILSLTERNVCQLSPQFHNFDHLQKHEIYVFAGEFESEKFKNQSKDFFDVALKDFQCATFKIYDAADHFDIVEQLAESHYEMSRLIIQNSNQI